MGNGTQRYTMTKRCVKRNSTCSPPRPIYVVRRALGTVSLSGFFRDPPLSFSLRGGVLHTQPSSLFPTPAVRGSSLWVARHIKMVDRRIRQRIEEFM